MNDRDYENERFPYSHHETLAQCQMAGKEYMNENNSDMSFKCVEWN